MYVSKNTDMLAHFNFCISYNESLSTLIWVIAILHVLNNLVLIWPRSVFWGGTCSENVFASWSL